MILPQATVRSVNALHVRWVTVLWATLASHARQAGCLLGLMACLGSIPAVAADAAGQVVFVAGAATRTPDGGSSQTVVSGLELVQGDLLQTSPQAYVYVRMADGGLLVLRPQSRLHINRWYYNEQHPKLSEIKYTLDEGVARYVSGKGSHAAKDKFRFNTPVAAIGVRGTDFTVLAQADLSQVQVSFGGVIVSSLGSGCLADGLGPCEGDRALELYAANAPNKMLQVRLGDHKPQLLEISPSNGPDRVHPPATDEPHVDNSGTAAAGALVTEAARADAVQGLASKPSADLQMARWGRWGALANGQDGVAVIEDMLSGRSLLAINRYYVIAANPNVPLEMPQAGVGHFRLFAHDGLMIDPQTGQIVGTTATAGGLQIDFGARRFATQLALQAGNWSDAVSSQGSIERNGKFASDPFVSSLVVDGQIGGKTGSEAIYLYRRAQNQGVEVSGVASWKR